MGFCTKCGAKIDVNSQFCVKCGTQISVARSDGANTQISESSKGWKKQYLIKTKGTVVVERERVYSIAARDVEEAQIRAKSIYGNEFKPVDIICVDAEDRLGRSMTAMFFMIIAIAIAFVNDDLRPNFTTCIYAIVIELSVIIRAKGIKNTVNSWIDIVFMVLIVMLIASILRPLTSSYQPGWMRKIEKTVREIYEFFKKDGDDFTFAIPTHFFLIASIVCGWAGARIASVACIAVVWVLATKNFEDIGSELGVFAIIYALSLLIGILLYISVEPAYIEFINRIKNNVKGKLRQR